MVKKTNGSLGLLFVSFVISFIVSSYVNCQWSYLILPAVCILKYFIKNRNYIR